MVSQERDHTGRTAAAPAPRRQLNRRQFLATGTATAAALTAATRPARSAAQDVTELTFWKPPHGTRDPELFTTLFDQFSQEHPTIRVTHTAIPWASVDESFTAAFAGGSPPDVFYLPDEWYPKYVNQGQIADLTSIFGDLEAEYDPNIWSIGTYQGQLYGVPFLAVIHAMLLNMDLFEAAGLAAPQTWEEIEAAAVALTNLDQGIYGMEMPGDTTWNMMVPLLATGGARMITDDLTAVGTDTSGAVAAWDVALRRIAYEHQATTPLSFTLDQRRDLGFQGQIAMMWRGGTDIEAIAEQAPDMALEVMPMPPQDGVDGAQPAVWTNAGYLFIAEGSPNKDQAIELVRYLASRQVQEQYVLEGVNLISPMLGVEPAESHPLVAELLTFLPDGVGPVVSTHWADASQALSQEAQGVITGQKSSEQALADYAAIVAPVLDGE